VGGVRRTVLSPAERVVTLQKDRVGQDSYNLRLRLKSTGDLIIEGHDLGAGVAKCWGGSEYEWALTIKAADVPAYLRCLGGAPDDDILDLVSARFREDPRCVQTRFLKERGIPMDFWSHVGD
jgi:hypothetical protein